MTDAINEDADTAASRWAPAVANVAASAMLRPVFALALLSIASCMGCQLFGMAIEDESLGGVSLFANGNVCTEEGFAASFPSPSQLDGRDENFVSLYAIETGRRVAKSLLAFSVFVMFLRFGSKFLLPDEKKRNKKSEKKSLSALDSERLRKMVDQGL